MNRFEYKLQGLGCANCAAKIEHQVSDLPWVRNARLDFATATLVLDPLENASVDESAIRAIVKKIEPDVILVSRSEPAAPEKARHSKEVLEMLAGLVLFVLALSARLFPALPAAVGPVLYVLASIVAGYKVFLKGLRQALKLRLDENTLMAVAVIAALVMGEFFEGAMVAILFNIGEFLEEVAVGRSRRQIEALTEIRPDKANLLTGSGEAVEADAEGVAVGQMILIRPFDRVPLDCVVTAGESEIDSAALTGESVPQAVSEGSALLSGMVNQSGLLEARVTNDYKESAASRIIEMVQSASAQKAVSEKTITKFARIYTPIVVLIALFLSFLPPLFGWGALNDWLMRGLVFLVASCPCALVISVPLGFFSAIGGMSKKGILLKGGKYLEALAKTQAVAFDKTGTLTKGILKVDEIQPTGALSAEEILSLAAAAERHSTHPIAQALRRHAEKLTLPECGNYAERAGLGVVCETREGRVLMVGRGKLLEKEGISLEGCPEGEVYVALSGEVAGVIRVSDTVRAEAPETVRRLQKMGIKRTIMLTGDGESAAKSAAAACGITELRHNLFPQDKVNAVLEIQKETGSVAFVGDGINDAPVLAASSCGVAMGFGSPAAIEAADMVLMSGTPDRLPDAIRLARRAMRVIRFNIAFALVCKFFVLLLAVFGLAPMWLAVFADVGVTLLAVLNSGRLLRPAMG